MKLNENILKYNEFYPKVNETSFIASGAKIIGNVTLGENTNIWYNTVLRGDVDAIVVGDNTNIQDCSVVHSSRFNGETKIGNFVTIGHSVVIHACTIMNYGFIGMHSTIMDEVIVEEYGFVAAGALVTPGKIIKSRQLWGGVPAKYIRDITDEEMFLIEDSWFHYVKLADNHQKSTKEQ